jgi:hypothetical protein
MVFSLSICALSLGLRKRRYYWQIEQAGIDGLPFSHCGTAAKLASLFEGESALGSAGRPGAMAESPDSLGAI